MFQTLFTIGHSTRSIEEFIGLLTAYDVQLVADVRRFPASRRYPHFNAQALAQSLEMAGMRYQHMPSLGGRRPAKADSTNTGWRNAGFRGYADYMQTDEFWSALEDLIESGKRQKTAVMCAEAVPWRCHRQLIADALVSRGYTVSHIFSDRRIDAHVLTSFAHVADHRLTYPSEHHHPSLF